MGCPVVLTPQALDDLEGIVSFIARDNPLRAETFGQTLIAKALSIGRHSKRGRVVPEISDATVRELVHGSYRIIYKVNSNPTTVFVLRLWHGARGAPELQEAD